MFILVREAAEAAGFRVLRLIHEPAAALLAYDIGQECSSGKRCSAKEKSNMILAQYILMYTIHLPFLEICLCWFSFGSERIVN